MVARVKLPSQGLQVLAREGTLCVVSKPAGVRSTREHPGDPDCVEAWLEDAHGQRFWAVHQLDRDTSGSLLLVSAKGDVDRWQKRLRAGAKTYLALCRGRVGDAMRWTIEAPLERRPDGRTVVASQGKPARTRFRLRGRKPDSASQGIALVACRPETGRTHQVRVHLAHCGLPLLGDARYATPETAALASRHMLHLHELKVAGRTFMAPVPSDFEALAAEHGLELPT